MCNYITASAACLLLTTIAWAERLPVKHFAQQAEYLGMQLSPDGNTVVYIHKTSEKQDIGIRDLKSGESSLINIPKSDVPWDPKDVRLGWVNSHRILFGVGSWGFAAIERDGSHFRGLSGMLGAQDQRTQYGLNLGGVLHLLRDEEAGQILATEYDLHFTFNEAEVFLNKSPHVTKINTRTGKSDRIIENPGNIVQWIPDTNGVMRVALETKRGIGRTIHRNTAQEKWKPLPGMDWNDTTVRPLGIGENNNTLYVMKKSPQGMWAVYPYDLARKEFGEAVIAHKHYDIIPKAWQSRANGIPFQSLIFSPSRELLGVRYITEFPRVMWFDEGLAQIQSALNTATAAQDKFDYKYER